MHILLLLTLCLACGLFAAEPGATPGTIVDIRGADIYLDNQAVKLKGLRLSNALFSDAETDELIANLPVFKSYGINAFSVFVMGSRFGDIKGYLPDASLNPTYSARLARVLEAADRERMVLLIGCLYWSTSEAKQDLGAWGQADAERAVANTVRFVTERGYRNVIFDPDNEGMAERATSWDIKKVIDAGHAVNTDAIIGYNGSWAVPSNADLTFHFGTKVSGKPWFESEGTPTIAPGGYWGSYSKTSGLYNYINIGIYNADMKANQINNSNRDIDDYDGYFCASTWLQCVPPYGPNNEPGGDGSSAAPGVRWWLEHLHNRYGAYEPGTPPIDPPTTDDPEIQSLRLINPDTGADLGSLSDGDTVALSLLGSELSIVATTSNTDSVVFDLNQGEHIQQENNAPYALFGDSNGTYTPWTPSLGDHHLVVTPYAGDNASGTKGTSHDIHFTVVATAPSGPAVTGVYLVNASTNSRITSLSDGSTVQRAQLSDQLAIEVTLNAQSESVLMNLDDGAHIQIENNAPYALFGDTGGNFSAGTLADGEHQLTLTAYSANSAGGAAGPTTTLHFSIEAETVMVNFQPSGASVPAGYVTDSGAVFGDRTGGLRYGWTSANDSTRERQADDDQVRDTLIHLNKNGIATWNLELTNGVYDVSVLCGDPSYTDQINSLSIEGTTLSDTDGMDHFDQFDVVVEVSDGMLTITQAADGSNAKLNAISVTALPAPSN
jgi:hypothetical protein